jgi:hypothetical protein
MNEFDWGVMLIAIRNTLPTKRLAEFDEIMYRGALCPQASDALKFAMGVSRPTEPYRPFEVIVGGAA